MPETMNPAIAEWFAAHEAETRALIHAIWETPELGFHEYSACEKVAAFMRDAGFAVQTAAAEDFDNPDATPNTVIARWGTGKPVVGILGELDALPGLGQKAVPYHAPLDTAGHGCGHNLMGGGAAGAACALKYAMEKEKLGGTIVLVDCPAEEVGSGKIYLARHHVFDGIDVILSWHPFAGVFNFDDWYSKAVNSLVFTFRGKTAHAAGNPWDGRSALDAVQLMNLGVEFLREHIPVTSRLHYVISDGGKAPNIVPDRAEVRYYVRSLDDDLQNLTDRVLRCAQGAAMMTDTEFSCRLLSGLQGMVPNTRLNRCAYDASLKVGKIAYTPEEYAFARETYRNITGKEAPDDETLLPTEVADPATRPLREGGCTDVGDVSHIVPTIHFNGGAHVADTPGHHWGVTAVAGMSIGEKASLYCHRIIAQAALDIFHNPEIAAECRQEFASRKIPPYEPRLG